MNKKQCPWCQSTQTVRNGSRGGRQNYLCRACGHQFNSKKTVSPEELWNAYQDGKQSIHELALSFRMSDSSVKRRLKAIRKEWEQPSLSGSGFVHIDVTYRGRNDGIILALDSRNGRPLYMDFIGHETIADYAACVRSIEERGYVIKGIILDGSRRLYAEFQQYPIQMCQFHMKQIVRRYLTRNPKILAARALYDLMDTLTITDGKTFIDAFNDWKAEYAETINKRSTYKDGSRHFTHVRLRSAMLSIDFFLPFLFTYQKPGMEGMPNTNNRIEGTFSSLKRSLNNHCGMPKDNRRRYVIAYFQKLMADTL